MKKLTVEDAKRILAEYDDSVPSEFEVKRVAYSKSIDAYFVEWINGSLENAYKDGVADSSNPKSARNAYSIDVKSSYSVIFINDSQTGSGSDPAVIRLNDEEKKKYMDTVKDLRVIDAV